jgi:dTDP-4-dehydrorhamnose 3,5-epimerase
LNFIATKLKEAFIIEPERLEDERGFFARTWCEREFAAYGLDPRWVQCNISFNKKKGTLRGLHYQTGPGDEARLVRCTMGGIYDVIVDLRPDSKTFGQWFSVELTAENRKMIFIPRSFAHGFLTLQDDSEIFYHMSAFYAPEYARGIRWNDPAFGIHWPAEVQVISDRDRNYPNFVPHGEMK